MSVFGRRLRLRWPSTDHRDYQTTGRLAARRSGASSLQAPSIGERSPDAGLPALGRIVRVHHEEAVLHVEFASYRAAPRGRSPVSVPDVTTAHAAAERAPGETAATATWTVAVILN